MLQLRFQMYIYLKNSPPPRSLLPPEDTCGTTASYHIIFVITHSRAEASVSPSQNVVCPFTLTVRGGGWGKW